MLAGVGQERVRTRKIRSGQVKIVGAAGGKSELLADRVCAGRRELCRNHARICGVGYIRRTRHGEGICRYAR